MRKRKRQADEFNIAFLDVICCGFGAIILLLMITKVADPIVDVESKNQSSDEQVTQLQTKLFKIRGESKVVQQHLDSKREQLSDITDKVARLQGDLTSLQGEFNATNVGASANNILEGKLASAKQSLTAEMKRLLGRQHKRSNTIIGGIPVDSEYLVFIIDTSGSMVQSAWPRLQREIIATLDVYPQVKGIQIMNDMGNYMFPSYRGKWIPDSPGRRKVLIRTLQHWTPFSNSSPVEGVAAAIRAFYDSGKKISLYVYGDDFSGGSIRSVIGAIDQINRENKKGQRLVRIHSVGFPHLIMAQSNARSSSARFAALMREMSYRNGGTFVGLTPN